MFEENKFFLDFRGDYAKLVYMDTLFKKAYLNLERERIIKKDHRFIVLTNRFEKCLFADAQEIERTKHILSNVGIQRNRLVHRTSQEFSSFKTELKHLRNEENIILNHVSKEVWKPDAGFICSLLLNFLIAYLFFKLGKWVEDKSSKVIIAKMHQNKGQIIKTIKRYRELVEKSQKETAKQNLQQAIAKEEIRRVEEERDSHKAAIEKYLSGRREFLTKIKKLKKRHQKMLLSDKLDELNKMEESLKDIQTRYNSELVERMGNYRESINRRMRQIKAK